MSTEPKRLNLECGNQETNMNTEHSLPGGWKLIGERAYRWDPDPNLTYFVTGVFSEGPEPKRYLVFFSRDTDEPQSINHHATSPQQGWQDCNDHFEKNFLSAFEERSQAVARCDREAFEARTPRLWHCSWPLLKFSPHEDFSDVRLGLVVSIDDGFVSEDCKAGQVWHRALCLQVFLFWLTVRVRLASPHGRLIPYNESDLPTH